MAPIRWIDSTWAPQMNELWVKGGDGVKYKGIPVHTRLSMSSQTIHIENSAFFSLDSTFVSTKCLILVTQKLRLCLQSINSFYFTHNRVISFYLRGWMKYLRGWMKYLKFFKKLKNLKNSNYSIEFFLIKY